MSDEERTLSKRGELEIEVCKYGLNVLKAFNGVRKIAPALENFVGKSNKGK